MKYLILLGLFCIASSFLYSQNKYYDCPLSSGEKIKVDTSNFTIRCKCNLNPDSTKVIVTYQEKVFSGEGVYKAVPNYQIKICDKIYNLEYEDSKNQETTALSASSKLFGLSMLNDAKLIKSQKVSSDLIGSVYDSSCIPSNYQPKTQSSSSGDKLKSSILGLDVTNLADALARHIVASFKKDMEACFFDRFYAEIETINPDFKILFPTAYNIISTMSTNIYNTNLYATTLREGLVKDILRFPNHMETLLNNQDSKLFSTLNISHKDNLKLGINIVNGLAANKHPGAVIEELDLSKYPNLETKFSEVLKMSKLVNFALRDTFISGNNPYWISLKDYNELVSDTELFSIYKKLFIAKTNKSDLSQIFKPKVIEIVENGKLENLYEVYKNFDRIQYGLNSIKLTNNIGEKSSIVSGVISDFIDVLENVNNLFPNGDNNSDLELFKNGIGVISHCLDHNYTMMFANFNSLISTTNLSNSSVGKFFNEHGLFIGQLLDVSSSDDIQAVLEMFLLPQGGWRLKKESPFSVSLDSYLGGGRYFTYKEKDNFGLSTPVGISLNWRFRIKEKWDMWAFSVIGTAVDIGPLTAYRFNNNNDTSGVARIYLKEILAPGIFASLLVPFPCTDGCFPLTINFGYQRFGLLQRVSATSNVVDIHKRHGIVFSINYNAPLYSLYSRRRS